MPECGHRDRVSGSGLLMGAWPTLSPHITSEVYQSAMHNGRFGGVSPGLRGWLNWGLTAPVLTQYDTNPSIPLADEQLFEPGMGL